MDSGGGETAWTPAEAFGNYCENLADGKKGVVFGMRFSSLKEVAFPKPCPKFARAVSRKLSIGRGDNTPPL
jgi:hypothetical protein